MSKKVTWEDMFKDFKRRHPNLGKRIVDWRPCGYATIKLYIDDGLLAKYYYDERCVYYTSERWIVE